MSVIVRRLAPDDPATVLAAARINR